MMTVPWQELRYEQPCREGASQSKDVGFSLAPPSHSEQYELDFYVDFTTHQDTCSYSQ